MPNHATSYEMKIKVILTKFPLVFVFQYLYKQ